MSQYEPATFVELAHHLEQIFTHHEVFYAGARGSRTVKRAELVSIELKEVQFRKWGISGVHLKFDVVFDSAGNTVQARTDFVLLGYMKIYGLVLGRSKADPDTGYTSRTLTCEVSRDYLCGPMFDEMEKFRKNSVEKMSKNAVKALKSSEAYKAEAAQLKQLGREIRSLQRKQERLQGRLQAQEAQAAEDGKPPFKVVIE